MGPVVCLDARLVPPDCGKSVGGTYLHSQASSDIESGFARPTHVVAMSEALTYDRDYILFRQRTLDGRLRRVVETAGDIIWTVDLAMRPTYVSPTIQRHLGYTVEDALALSMEQIFAPSSYDRAMRLLLEEMSREDEPDCEPDRTVTLEVDLVHRDGYIVPFEVNYSALRDEKGALSEVLAVARDIRKRREAERSSHASTQKLVDSLHQTVQALATLCEMRDPYTAGHQRRVASLACAIGKKMGLSERTLEGLHFAGLIHDIGKVRVPAEILTSPRALTSAEYDIIKTHPSVGREILIGIDFPWPIADAVYQHHEKLDGSGYPSGVRGVDIVLEARVLAVADVVEAIASDRPYRPALGIDIALDEIREHRGTWYEPSAVDACVDLFARGEFSFEQHPVSVDEADR